MVHVLIPGTSLTSDQSDIYQLSDATVWLYGEALREMVRSNFFDRNVKVVHTAELLDATGGQQVDEHWFLSAAGHCRRIIDEQFSKGDGAMKTLLKDDPDSLLTYQGFKKFLEVDLAQTALRAESKSKNAYRRTISALSLRLMARSEGFGKIMRTKMPNHVRLSMHPSSGVAKLSICLVPQPTGNNARSPWMSCIAVDQKGIYRTVHAKDVKDTHEMVRM